MGNALVKAELKRTLASKAGKQGGKLSPPAPRGRQQEETENVKKAKAAGNGLDEERGEKAASALRTLMESSRIAKNKELMADVHAHAAAHMKSISEVLSGPVKRGRK
jgi:hypothetical protein